MINSTLNMMFIGLGRFVNNVFPASVRQAAILNALPSHVALLNNDGTIIEVNEAWKDFAKANNFKCINYGIGSNYLAIAREAIGEDEAIRKQMAHGVRKVLSGNLREFSIEYPYHSSNGKKWFKARISPAGSGNGMGAVIIHLDVTERKLAEEKIRKSEANLTAIIENADAHVYSIDRDFRYITFNSVIRNSLKAIYGIEIKPGDKVFEFLEGIDPAEAREWEGIYTEAMLGKPIQFVKDYSRPGVPEFVHFSINPIWENENVIGLACFARDVTQQRLSVDELKASEQRFRQVTNNPILGVTWLSSDGRILNANEAFCKMLGYTNLEILDMHFSEFTSVEDIGTQYLALEQLFLQKTNSCRWEKRYVRKCGEIMWGELILSSVKNNDGLVKYVIGVVQDITGRKRAEEELVSLNESLEGKIRERTAELQEANRELETFSYTVSHDLKSPLRVIRGFSKLLLADYSHQLDEKGSDYIQMIDRSASRMNVLVQDILNFSKIGKTGICRTMVNMNEIVTSVLLELQEANQGLKASVIIGELGDADCDPVLIKQAWINLLGNALKYSSKKDEPLIQIGMKRDVGDTVYFIRDNGAGFDMKYAERLFKPFQRLHSDFDFEGSGVGLATVHRIITKHGGLVWTEARVNEGATFYFTLPV